MQFAVDNMTCGHCVRAITGALQRLDPQARINVDLDKSTVEAVGNFSAAEAIAAMAIEGYPALEKSSAATHKETAIDGSTCCGSCHT